MRRLFSPKTPEYLEGLVEEVIIDPTYLTRGEHDLLIDPESYISDYLHEAPANSVLFRILNDKKDDQVLLAYPFFPSHFNLPVKVGEVVWIISVGSEYYWMCRQVSRNTVEDANITHSTRWGMQPVLTADEETDQQNGERENILPDIPTPNENTFRDIEDDSDIPTFRDHLDARLTNINIPEAVPRYTKRPGDLVLQGSNNTLICLGTDRGYSKRDLALEDDPSEPGSNRSSAWTTPSENSGTIDMVTGRARYLLDNPTNATFDSNRTEPDRTSPFTILNESETIEVDKAPFVNWVGKYKNLKEGDPDFAYDASRLYISSKTQPDSLFDLLEHYSKIPKWGEDNLGNAELVESVLSQASIVVKSDEIRIVSRYLDPESEDFQNSYANSLASAEKINGSIKIVKEGTRDDAGHSTIDGNGASVIAMQSDGVVMIDGSSIVIGSGREIDTNGEGNQVFLGADATEPIVLGTQLQNLLTDFFNALQTWISTKFDNHVHPTGVGPSGRPEGFTGDNAGTQSAIENITQILSKIGKTK